MAALIVSFCAGGVSFGGGCGCKEKATPFSEFAKVTLLGNFTVAGASAFGRGGTVELELSDIPSTGWPVEAYLFWAAQADALDEFADITLITPSQETVQISGQVWGWDCSDCWATNYNVLWWADVTQWVSENGTYTLTGFASLGNAVPGVNGFTLVVIYCDTAQDNAKRTVSIWAGDIDLEGCGPPSTSWTQTGFKASRPLRDAKASLTISEVQDGFPNYATFNDNFIQYFYGISPWEHYQVWVGNVTAWMSGGDTSATWYVERGEAKAWDCIAPVLSIISVTTNEEETFSCALGVKESASCGSVRFKGVRGGALVFGRPGSKLSVEVYEPSGRLVRQVDVQLGSDGKGFVSLERGVWLLRAGRFSGKALVR